MISGARQAGKSTLAAQHPNALDLARGYGLLDVVAMIEAIQD